MERKSLAKAACPIARSVDLIGEWGSLLILREAFGGTTRFEEFQRSLGISRNLLALRLKKLVEGGVLERRPVAAEAKRHEYRLTRMGEDLLPMMVSIRQWGDRWLFTPETVPADMIDTTTGSHVAPLEVRSLAGRTLAREDIRLRSRKGGAGGSNKQA